MAQRKSKSLPYEAKDEAATSTDGAVAPLSFKPHKLVLVVMTSDSQKAAGVTVEDGATVVYTANSEGMIKADPEHVATLCAMGWTVVE